MIRGRDYGFLLSRVSEPSSMKASRHRNRGQHADKNEPFCNGALLSAAEQNAQLPVGLANVYEIKRRFDLPTLQRRCLIVKSITERTCG